MKQTKPKRAAAKPLTDPELDRVLRAAKVPAWPKRHWRKFPRKLRGLLPRCMPG